MFAHFQSNLKSLNLVFVSTEKFSYSPRQVEGKTLSFLVKFPQ